MVITCPNCRMRLTLPKLESSKVKCEWCGKVFTYHFNNIRAQPQKPQLSLFGKAEKEVKAPYERKDSLQEEQVPIYMEQHLLEEEREKAARLFDYIAKVLSIDLPIIRNILDYKEQLWWLNDVPIGSSCELRKAEPDKVSKEAPEEGWWLRVRRVKVKEAPPLPEKLEGWVELDSRDPTKLPEVIQVRSHEIPINEALDKEASSENSGENSQTTEKATVSEKFEDDPARPDLFSDYIANQWKPWSEAIMPYYKANQLYSELYSLHQRLQIDGERIEFLFGHAILTWRHKQGVTVNHPLFVTPIEIHCDPDNRTIFLLPSASLPTTPEFDCLRDLEYDNVAKIVELVDKLTREPPDVWDNKEMYGLAQTITGLVSPDGVNEYAETMCSNPPINKEPTIWNAPIFFVRPRAKKFWVQDAEQVREAIKDGSSIPWFISSLTANPAENELPNIAGGNNEDISTENILEGELLLPLPYNDEQKEIALRLRSHNGVLVQGPPGTGKSHTIVNIICSLLAQGKRILVTAQTDRALKVLREKIPKEIRSLCVSQLGSDIGSRKETEGAVKEICAKLDRSEDSETKSRIDEIRQELRSNRENQARIRSAIRRCIEMNFERLSLGMEKIDAVRAAKEVSANQQKYGWLPDKLSPSDEPPLTNEELEELCRLLSQIDPKDRKTLSQELPRLENLPHPNKVEEVTSHLQEVSSTLRQLSRVPDVLTSKLVNASPNFVEETYRLTEAALSRLQTYIKEPWQHEVLHHLSVQGAQQELWHAFVSKAQTILDMAWKHFKKTLNHEIY